MSKATKRYEASVERALGLFDTTNEWADYIAFLSRLHRALKDGPEGAEIPTKRTVARYLAQCLNPSLPSGVHQKALEVYAVVFENLGSDRLALDLATYLPGISNTLSFASLSIRPLFLSLLRGHILKVPVPALRPALKAIILSLLPGIEEEGAEDFEATLSVINAVRDLFTREAAESLFWQNLFLASMTSPHRRLGVFVYLSRYLPKLGRKNTATSLPQPTQVSEDVILTPEPGLLIRCFATALLDDQVLIQRNFLDLLVTHLPLDAPVLQPSLATRDLDILVSAAMTVVLRRDMSLNKRLWTWLLGSQSQAAGQLDSTPASPEESQNHRLVSNGQHESADESSYFMQYGLDSLLRSFQAIVREDTTKPAERSRPFRIALSLMDKWEVGGPVVAATFVPLMRNLQHFQKTVSSPDAFAEVFRSANVFFNGVESGLIWSQLFLLLEAGDTDLITFVLAHFDVQEEEMLTLHVPLVCLAILHKLDTARMEGSTVSNTKASRTGDEAAGFPTMPMVDLLLSLVEMVPPRAFTSEEGKALSDRNGEGQDNYKIVKDFYTKLSKGSRARTLPLSPPAVGRTLMHQSAMAFLKSLECRHQSISSLSLIVASVVSKVSDTEVLNEVRFCSRTQSALESEILESAEWTYRMASSISIVLIALCDLPNHLAILPDDRLQLLVALLARHYWTLLAPFMPQYHVESTRYLVELDRVSVQHRVVESTIASLLIRHDGAFSNRIQKFTSVWAHIRTDNDATFLRQSLLLLVDALLVESSADDVKEWIQSLSFSSLELLCSLIVDASTELRLRRLHALLAAQSDQQWSVFGEEPARKLRQTTGELCLKSLLQRGDDNGPLPRDAESIQALRLVRLVYDQDGVPTDLQELGPKFGVILLDLLREKTQPVDTQIDLLNTTRIILKHVPSAMQFLDLMTCLMNGISFSLTSPLDKWISLLCFVVLNGGDSIFQVMMKLTERFCARLDSSFTDLRALFDPISVPVASDPEQEITYLMSGLEYILACAQDRLQEKEGQRTTSSPEQIQGLFGSMMGTVAHAPEGNPQRSSLANDRLTVVLCFQDAVKVCVRLWIWGASTLASSTPTKASFHYISSKVRSRSRRTLEHFLRVETQECLETITGLWVISTRDESSISSISIMKLLQSLEGGRPRVMLPATFNAIYNRTNPAALDKGQRSTLSTAMSASEVAVFLTEYTTYLEDDLLEEIWTDCTTFLREVLGNPMPHRQILLHLLDFMSALCSKIENTNFGEERKMRRELGDLCTRLFTAIFTVKPDGLETGLLDEPPTKSTSNRSMSSPLERRSVLQILQEALPLLSTVLAELDRLTTVLNGIATNVTGPLLRSKTFPQTVTMDLLALMRVMAKASGTSKIWRRDVLDAFSEPKFFQSAIGTVKTGWLPLIRLLASSEKTLMPDALSSITPPSSAGLVFGVGATAARADADRKMQLTLRRIAVLMLAAEKDSFAGNLAQLLAKVEELLTATKDSSPSSATREDIFILFRAIVLSHSPFHLAPLWPVIDSELRETFSTILADSSTYSISAELMAAKLLDLLLLLKPDEFQLHEWLFVTDTVDAIYPPAHWTSVALIDQVAQATPDDANVMEENESPSAARKPWLCSGLTRTTPLENVQERVVQPFFRQLSIHAFEDSYSLSTIDLQACVDDLLADLFTV